MEKIRIHSDILPSKENNFTIKTKDGTILRELKKYLSENFKDKFVSIDLFYESKTDKIRITKVDKDSDILFSEFITQIEQSEYGYLFDFESQ